MCVKRRRQTEVEKKTNLAPWEVWGMQCEVVWGGRQTQWAASRRGRRWRPGPASPTPVPPGPAAAPALASPGKQNHQTFSHPCAPDLQTPCLVFRPASWTTTYSPPLSLPPPNLSYQSLTISHSLTNSSSCFVQYKL